MIPLPIYLDSYPTDLAVAFSEYQLEMGEFIGYGSDSDLWTTKQTDELDRRVQEAWRNVLYPPTLPGERVPHVWSWSLLQASLVTAASDDDYTFPTDFGSIYGGFTWGVNSNFNAVKQVSEFDIRRLRQSGTTGRPTCFAVRWRAQTVGTNQRKEAVFYPKPNGVYTLYYVYAVNASVLSNTNVYTLGGPRISQLMIESCRAVGESVKNGGRGDQWNIFERSLAAAIQMDRGTLTDPSAGVMRPTLGFESCSMGPSIGEVSYHFGPTAGTYTLEV